KRVSVFFVDFASAFDEVDSATLLFILGKVGVPTKCINILKSLYSHTSARVWTYLGLSQPFGIEPEVKQVSGLSPLLFSLYINDIVDSLGGGVKINGKRISALLYADDLVLLEVHPSVLQKVMINRLEEYCGVWN
ncbi:hypothetical protein AAG570_002107, partial [Ranatra chinensis]